RNVSELAKGDPALLAEVVATAKMLAEEHAAGEYRLVFNEGASAGQTVFHVPAHVLGAGPDGELAEGTRGQERGARRGARAVRGRRDRDGPTARAAGPPAQDRREPVSARTGARARQRGDP